MNLTKNNSSNNGNRFEIILPRNTAKAKKLYNKRRLLYTAMKSYTIAMSNFAKRQQLTIEDFQKIVNNSRDSEFSDDSSPQEFFFLKSFR